MGFHEGDYVKTGHHANWVGMVMQCVISVQYKVRFNSDENDLFKTTWGLRQGVPSPHLFLLCSEGPTTHLSHAEQSGKLAGVKVC